MENAKQKLRENNISPSVIRINVYQYMFDNDEHHTVDEIYKNIIDKIPTLSKASVYNTLELFLDKGIVKQVRLDSNTSYYELKKENHSHFICEKCGEIHDIPEQTLNLKSKGLEDFKINKVDILMKGVCKKCL